MISIGWYNGKSNTAPFVAETVKDIPAAQLWLKNHLDMLKANSYGLRIWETDSWYAGPGKKAQSPRVYFSWHRDGEDCYGQLYNPQTGWKFYIRNGRIAEEYVPKEE